MMCACDRWAACRLRVYSYFNGSLEATETHNKHIVFIIITVALEKSPSIYPCHQKGRENHALRLLVYGLARGLSFAPFFAVDPD